MESKMEGKTTNEKGIVERTIGHLYHFNPADRLADIVESESKKYSGKIEVGDFIAQCVDSYFTKYGKVSELVTDLREIVNYFKAKKLIFSTPDENKILMPLYIKENIKDRNVRCITDIIERMPDDGLSHLPSELAESICAVARTYEDKISEKEAHYKFLLYRAQNENKEGMTVPLKERKEREICNMKKALKNVGSHVFAYKCVENYKGNTTDFFYDIVRALQYLSQPGIGVIKAENAHFELPLKFNNSNGNAEKNENK